MIILGVDPGSRAMGWGVVRFRPDGQLIHLDHGVFRTTTSSEFPQRLAAIYDEIRRICLHWEPTVAAVEDVFQHKNVRSAMVLASARTSALLALVHCSVQVFSYTPSQVKQSVTGSGRAEKHQVGEMVRFLLALEEVPPSDAGDALGVALCHGMRAPSLGDP